MKRLVKRDRDGIYYCRPYLGVNQITGKPIRPYKRFPSARSEEEAEAMASEWLERQHNAASLGVSGRLTDLLVSYVDVLEAAGTPVNTVKTYRSCISAYITPNVGKMRVDTFTAPVIQSLYNIILMRESRKGGTVTPRTVLKLHWFLCGAFKYFASHGLSSHNPMADVVRPHPRNTEAVAFSEYDFTILSAFLDDVLREPADSRDSAFFRMVAFATYTALWHGTRCGETLALLWPDIQFARSTMHVAGTIVEKKGAVIRQPFTKNGKSRNVTIHEECIDVIKGHEAWQRSLFERSQRECPRAVFTTMEGGYLRPSEVSRAFSVKIRDALGFPKSTHFHTLRHTQATYMILGGADIVSVKERYGHASEAFTLCQYGHLLPGRDEAAIEAFARFAAKVKEGRRAL